MFNELWAVFELPEFHDPLDEDVEVMVPRWLDRARHDPLPRDVCICGTVEVGNG
jgi:hypothetical protein